MTTPKDRIKEDVKLYVSSMVIECRRELGEDPDIFVLRMRKRGFIDGARSERNATLKEVIDFLKSLEVGTSRTLANVVARHFNYKETQ